ncbi:hypothetical protein CMI40_02745 [Candidatus Pacearchaeota archaeon]|nr:hypothetical protein [Candidatus Pacearchaeota archaeon]
MGRHVCGWCSHKEGTFKDNAVFKVLDCICNVPYDVKEDINHKSEVVAVYVDSKYFPGRSENSFKESLFDAANFVGIHLRPKLQKDMYDVAIMHSGSCPNCNHSKELFCESIGKTISQTKEWTSSWS